MSDAPVTVESLPWDTQFFGVPIGRVRAGSVDRGSLAAAEAEARRSGFACLYLRLAPAGPEALVAAHDAGWRLVDVAVDLARPVEPRQPALGGDVVVRHGTPDDLDLLMTAIDGLAPYSRFSVDPRFGLEEARRMYVAWVERAARAPDELLAVAEAPDGTAGFITCSCDDEARIGLLSGGRRGAGLGPVLIGAALDWAGERTDVLVTATQARNAGAMRFYERRGFLVRDVAYVYHRWLD